MNLIYCHYWRWLDAFHCRYWMSWLVVYRLTLVWLLHTEAQHYFSYYFTLQAYSLGSIQGKCDFTSLATVWQALCLWVWLSAFPECCAFDSWRLSAAHCVYMCEVWDTLYYKSRKKIKSLVSLLFFIFLCFTSMSFPSPFWPLFLLPPSHFSFLQSFSTVSFLLSLFLHPVPWHVCFSFLPCSVFFLFLSPLPLTIRPCWHLPPLYRVWEVTTGEVLNTLIHHNEAVLHLRFANGLMVTCSKDRSIAVWDMASPTDISLRRVLVGHRAAVNVVDFDDKYIVSASGDRTIKVTTVREMFLYKSFHFFLFLFQKYYPSDKIWINLMSEF